MGPVDSKKRPKLKASAGYNSVEPLKKKKTKNKKQHKEKEISQFIEEEKLHSENEETRKRTVSGMMKKPNKEKGNKSDRFNTDEADGEKKKHKRMKNKKKKDNIMDNSASEVSEHIHEVENGFGDLNGANEAGENNSNLNGKRRKNAKKHKELHNAVGDDTNQQNGKSKKSHKLKKKDRMSTEKDEKVVSKREGDEEDAVYEISSGDDDCSGGWKNWMPEYHYSKEGLKLLEQKLDDFLIAHEEQEEQARKEREALAAEGGWTVVVHQKGRKKTTESDSGVAVGSVAEAAVLDKMAKKKSKVVGQNFYRFQKREAQRTEIMMLQSKFEEDKKKLQERRAARKFKPY